MERADRHLPSVVERVRRRARSVRTAAENPVGAPRNHARSSKEAAERTAEGETEIESSMTDQNNDRLEGIVGMVMGAILMPVSILAAGFALSGAWLAWGLAGFILVGIAGAVAFIGPFGIVTGYAQYKEAA